MYVCTTLIFRIINYVVIEWIIYVKLRYGLHFRTRIEPVGEPYREVCLSPWKGNWRISKNRIDWRNVLLSEKNYFHEKELKENGNMT